MTQPRDPTEDHTDVRVRVTDEWACVKFRANSYEAQDPTVLNRKIDALISKRGMLNAAPDCDGVRVGPIFTKLDTTSVNFRIPHTVE